MGLNRQKHLRHEEVKSQFETIFNKKMAKSGLGLDSLNLSVDVYIDGPVTFTVLVNKVSTAAFTGWSKFNPNDPNYSELNGICRSMQKAVSKYIAAVKFEQLVFGDYVEEDEGETDGEHEENYTVEVSVKSEDNNQHKDENEVHFDTHPVQDN